MAALTLLYLLHFSLCFTFSPVRSSSIRTLVSADSRNELRRNDFFQIHTSDVLLGINQIDDLAVTRRIYSIDVDDNNRSGTEKWMVTDREDLCGLSETIREVTFSPGVPKVEGEVDATSQCVDGVDKQEKTSNERTLEGPNQFIRGWFWLMTIIGSALNRNDLVSALSRISSWYLIMLSTRPIITKSLTSGGMGVIGDLIAQKFEGNFVSDRNNTSTIKGRRTFALFVDGLFSGPVMHFAYEFFEMIIPTSGNVSSFAAISHCIADSIFLDSFFVATSFFYTGLVEGLSVRRDIIPQLRKDYIPAVKAGFLSSIGLMPLEFLIFRFLPLSIRSFAVNFLDIIWCAVISFMTHRSRQH